MKETTVFLILRDHLELVSQDKDDYLKCRTNSEWILIRDLLSTPTLALQCIAHDARWPAEPWVEVKCDISPWLYAAATGKVHLEPVRQHRGATSQLNQMFLILEFSGIDLSASEGTHPWIRTISPGWSPPKMVPAKGIVCGKKLHSRFNSFISWVANQQQPDVFIPDIR